MPRRSRKRRLPRESEECQLVGTRVSKQPHQRRSARLSQQHDVAEEKANKKVPYKKAETRRGKKQENQHRSDESTERQGAETGPANDPSHPSSAQHRQEVTPEKNVTSLTSSAEYEAEKCVIPDHGEKLLELFCSDCTRALCTKCHIDDHKGHRVQAYRDAIEGKTDEYQTCKEMAVPLLRKLQDQEVELLKMKAEKEKKKCDMEAVTSERFEKEAVDFTTKIKDLGDQIHHHDLEWDKHWGQVGQYRRKIEHHSEKNSKMRENEKEKKKVEVIMKLKDKCDSRIRTEFDKDAKMIDDAIKSVVSLRRGIKDNIVYGEALIADKHFRPGLHQDIEKTRNKLQELAGDAEVDRVTDLKAKMSVYSSATRVGRCEIPESEYIVYGVTFVTSDRIAICGCLKMRPPCTVRLWDVTSNVVEVVVEGSDWIRSLAYLGNNTIVSLNMAPVISIIDLNTKNVRGIEVNLDAAIEWLWNVAVDDRGYFLNTYGETGKMHLVLVDKAGEILQDIETGYPFLPTYCRKRGMVVLCGNTSDTITCYKLQDDSLTEVMSASHGVKGFECFDICSGSMGEIFIVGTMDGDKPREIRLYQLDIDEEKKQIKMRRIDLKEVNMRSGYWPRCSVLDDKLVITHDNKLELFRLS